MNARELAEKMKRLLGNQISHELYRIAKESRLVFVTDMSPEINDLSERGKYYSRAIMGFWGALEGEIAVSSEDQFTVWLDEKGIVVNDCEDPECPNHLNRLKYSSTSVKIEERCPRTITTNIPHETFNVFLDLNHLAYRGIVFSMEDVKGKTDER